MQQIAQKSTPSDTGIDGVETLGSIVSRWLEINDLAGQTSSETIQKTDPAEVCETKLLTV